MAERSDLMMLAKVQRLRAALTRAAAERSLSAIRECDSAEQSRDLGSQTRDAADADWQRMLGEIRPDPQLVRLGGRWLLEKQRLLEAAELDLGIAQSRRDMELHNHREALAREAAARKIRAKYRRAMERRQEERQSAQLTDSVLRRWHR